MTGGSLAVAVACGSFAAMKPVTDRRNVLRLVAGLPLLGIAGRAFAARSAHYDYMEAVWSVRMALRRAVAARLLAAREVEISAALAQTRELQRAAAERRLPTG